VEGELAMKNPAQISPRKGLPVAEVLPGDPVCKMAEEVHQMIAQRAYELFCLSGCTHGHDIHDWLQAEREVLTPMPIEVYETADEITVRAEVPGFLPKEIALGVEPGRLYISAQSADAAEPALPAFRIMEIEPAFDPRKAHASVGDGMLEIHLNKQPASRQTMALSQAA
jgi:HSP20 family molecular chaperone IbpA